uniref:Prepilin leader peptidase/N-methyltransferase n=1 Tax=Eiseniibacteriota bacterium TaxID=2212470 RepID=A0A832MNW7_UNCEI
MILDQWLSISAALLGLVMGSAVTALAHRVPRGISWVRGRSACPACGATLAARDLVPVLSWALTGGRCRHCGAGVPLRYPLTELWCAAWALLLYRQVGPGWEWVLLAPWGFLLVALFWIDLDHQLLPDALTFPGTLLGVAAALTLPDGARHALLGIVAGSGLLWLLAEVWVRVRKVEGLGGGDIKLAAMFGAVLGWKLTLLTLFLAAFAGSVWGGVLMARGQGTGRTALPFGTMLAPAAMIAFLWGADWVNAYARLLAGR